jgi:hypothetical protein
MTRLGVAPRDVHGWVQGVVEGAEPGTLAVGTIEEGKNFVPTRAGRQRTRGGSRIMLTLKDDNSTPANLAHVCAIVPFTGVGGLIIGWSDTENAHYAYRVTADMGYEPNEAGSIKNLTTTPSTTWDNASAPARPVMAEVWEKMFIADATTTFSARNELLGFNNAGTVTLPKFVFGSGSATALQPYCLEEYNGVLFVAGYGTEDSGDLDRPEFLRHSFLGKSPDAADGFDKDAWALIGSKGQRITALRKGRSILLVAKENEFYRVTGFGRAFAGWQYQIEPVENTQGLGIVNPKALIFAEGWWWGVGAQGPLRTDGFGVESLVGPRRVSWRGIDSVAEAWVAYHPERRLVLFGLHPTEAESGRSDTFPWRVWAWDIERSVWQPNHEFGADLFHASALTTTAGGGGPSAAPSSPSTSSITETGYTANWTNGDANAETELWEKKGSGGTWDIFRTVAAGVTSFAQTGNTSYTEYFWRVRHTKSGIKSQFDVDAGTSAKTLISKPGCTAAQMGVSSFIEVTLTQNADGTDLEVQRQVDSGGYTVWQTFSAEPSGTFVVSDISRACGQIVDYKARSRDSSWPADSSLSLPSTVDLSVDCGEE